MTLSIDSTVGGSSANCYCSLSEAEEYFEKRLHDSNWTSAATATKTSALVWATILLDQLISWDGAIADDSQALSWPRDFVYDPNGISIENTVIPQFLKNAVSEFALQLIIGDRLTDDYEGLYGLKRGKVGPLEIELSGNLKSQRRSILPKSVWIMVRQYGSRVGSKGGKAIKV